MPQKICKHCGESFTLLPGKPGYANECPECLHEKTRPRIDPDTVAAYLKRYPQHRRHLDGVRKAFLKLGMDTSTAESVIAEFVLHLQGTQK